MKESRHGKGSTIHAYGMTSTRSKRYTTFQNQLDTISLIKILWMPQTTSSRLALFVHRTFMGKTRVLEAEKPSLYLNTSMSC